MLLWPEYIKFFIGLIAIIDPFGSVPILINFSEESRGLDKKKIAFFAARTTLVVLLFVLLTGESVLHFLGISLASFQVGGGILILLMAISMMHGTTSRAKQTHEEARDLADRDAIAVVPLGIPLLAGPGAISTVILYANQQSTPGHYLLLAMIILATAFIVWIILRASDFISSFLGKTGINVMKRIMGLILAALGVEFIANGLKLLFPALC